jgi:gliding motility-associated-like protein
VSHAFKDKGVYDVKLEAITSDGCSVEITKPIAIEVDFDPLAPNAFTPDQNGMNDTFIPEAFKDRNDRFKMEIFSLNGELIYRTMDNSAAWNGHFNNTGRLMDEGIYVWKVIISNAEGKEKSFAGNVRIIQQ